tara:strand:+ start:9487 stop:9849 length:363 start_codon:yes stop_codon:yes gene_type:complete
MAIKQVTVVVPDKQVTIDGEGYIINPWSFSDDNIWAIQWNETEKRGDIEPNPHGDNEVLEAKDYDGKVKPYVDAWTKAKEAVVEADIKSKHTKEEQHKARKDAEAIGKLPRLPSWHYVDG